MEHDEKLTLAQSAALVWLAGVAPLASLLIPVLLPAMELSLHLAPHELSMAAAANLSGACISAVSAPLWLAKISSRQSILVALGVIILANTAAAFATVPSFLLPIMLLGGVGTGMALCGGIPLVRRSTRPARLMSAVQVWQLVLAAGALRGAGWLLTFAGLREVLLGVVVASVISIPVALSLPEGGAREDRHLPRLADMRPGAWALVAIFIYFASISTLTNYAGKLGVQNGLSLTFVSSALAIGNLGALPGSLIAALANDLTRQRLFLAVGTLLECAALAMLMSAHSAVLFGSAFFVIQICITLIVPIQVALLIEQDTSGRSIQAMGAMQAIGQAAGPLSVTFAITAANVDKAYYFAILYVVLGAILIIRPTLRHTATVPEVPDLPRRSL